MTKNARKELAKQAYLSPESPTFGNKSASLRKAGYSASYSEHFGSKVLVDIELTDEDVNNFREFVQEVPNVIAVMKKKRKQLEESNTVSAKDYTNFLRQIELTARLAGMFKETIEKREQIIKIEVPGEMKCPQCGYVIPNIVEREYERRSVEKPRQ